MPKLTFFLFLLFNLIFPASASADWSLDLDPPRCISGPTLDPDLARYLSEQLIDIRITGDDNAPSVVSSGLAGINLYLDDEFLISPPLSTSPTSPLFLPNWSAEPVPPTHTFYGTVVDNAGNLTRCSTTASFEVYVPVTDPWIQTQGDVHSNEQINTP